MFHEPVMPSSSGSRTVKQNFACWRVMASTSKILQLTTHCSTWQLTKKTGTTHKQETKQPMHRSMEHNEPRENEKQKTKEIQQNNKSRNRDINTHTYPENNTIKNTIKPPWYNPRHYILRHRQYNKTNTNNLNEPHTESSGRPYPSRHNLPDTTQATHMHMHL